MSCGIGRRLGLDPTLLWLWSRLVATVPIRSLAWEPPYAEGVAQEMAKRQTKTKKDPLRFLSAPLQKSERLPAEGLFG